MNRGHSSAIDAAIALHRAETIDIEKVASATGVKLAPDATRSTNYFQVFRGRGDPNSVFAEVECRIARPDASSRGTLVDLVINQASAPSGAEVISRLGQPYDVQVSPPEAQAAGSATYVYEESGGELRFAIKGGTSDVVLSIAISKAK